MKLGLVKSCLIGTKTLNILAQNNSLLFPKPIFSTKIKAFFICCQNLRGNTGPTHYKFL